MIKRLTAYISVCFLFIVPIRESCAQYFQFSLSSFSEQRINPAYVAMSDYATASLLYRQQSAAEDFNIKSSLASLSMPFVRRNGGSRWSGIGLTFLDDRSGENGIFQVQEIGLTYAIRVPIGYNQSLYFGARGLYESRQFSLNGLYTGTQYIPGRGFNTGISSGETPDDFQQRFFTFSTGLTWEATNRDGTRLAHAGFALFDINKVDQAFFSGTSVAPVTAVLEGGLHLTGPTELSMDPVALITFGDRTDVNLGAIWNYSLSEGSIGLITRYVFGRYAIAGLQYDRENLALGFSYDLPVHDQVANRGSFEFGIKLKRLVKSKDRKPRVKENDDSAKKELPVPQPPVVKTPGKIQRKESPEYYGELSQSAIKKVVFYRQAEKNNARAGDLLYYPYLNENSILTFHFDFNSSVLSQEAREYLEDIANLLKDNPRIRILITGHTDNLGNDDYNLKLSQERADRIRNFLINEGVDGKRIQAHGKGEEFPVTENSTEEGRARNRRVEFKILR